LSGILNNLPKFNSPNVLVDMSSMDDAGVYKISDDVALVQSVDFFSPIVNSPYDFGQIVAANSLSDIYAMGGSACTAMNVLAYPSGLIGKKVIEELLIGACEKLKEAKVSLIGGHTMEEENFIYGMSITGTIHPKKIMTNSSAKVGDVIILTKPLGVGPYADAHANDGLTKTQYKTFVTSLSRLNKYAAEAIVEFDVSAMTDVTGFGLLGHSLAIAKNADVLLCYDIETMPFFDNIFELMKIYTTKSVCKNEEYIRPHLLVEENVNKDKIKLITEAQTSGGLLIFINKNQSEKALEKLKKAGDLTSTIIGKVVEKENKKIFLKVT